MVVEIDDLPMKLSEQGSNHCRFEGSYQRKCDDTSEICNDCLNWLVVSEIVVALLPVVYYMMPYLYDGSIVT